MFLVVVEFGHNRLMILLGGCSCGGIEIGLDGRRGVVGELEEMAAGGAGSLF